MQTASQREEFNFDFKIMLLGDSCTGKTCLLIRFKDEAFLSNNFISTVGIDYRNKIVVIDDVRVKLQLWDTAGQERFRSVTQAYYRDANALLIVFDLTNKASFLNVRKWIAEIREYAKPEVVLCLVGNKSDLIDQRKITPEEGEKLAEEYHISYVETSAKTGKNVEFIFNTIAKELVSRKLNKCHNGVRLSIVDFAEEKSGGCCG